MKRKVLVACKYPLPRFGLVTTLNNSESYEVVVEIEKSGIQEVIESTYDAGIICFETFGALDFIKQLRKAGCRQPLIFIGDDSDTYIAESLLKAGGNGFCCWSEPCDGIIKALDTVFSKGIYLSDAMTPQLIGTAKNLDNISNREEQVLILVGKGYSNAEIAKSLTLSVKTVECHIYHICKKLQIPTHLKLVWWATKWTSSTYPV
jgi:DNA-binding NarL/FixJ family response regulator